ncbi:MAG: galactokinase, partial [Gemmatimonadota bacterium]|nr:galactokinase [Gemmatimonadota bacterium]
MSAAAVRALFRGRFAGEPAAVASAPGRVNLIGEHTDYNGGEVLPMGISRRTYVAVGLANAGVRSRAVSASEAEVGEFDPLRPTRSDSWLDYLVGVARELQERGIRVPHFDVAVTSDVPVGSGLSSSAALEVATATALLALVGEDLPPREVALLGQRAENRFVGVASGIMDQFASALARPGNALHLWCDSLETEQVPMRDAVLIFDTGVSRGLRESAFNQRRAECEEALALLRRPHPELPHLAAASPEQVRGAGLPEPLCSRALHVSEETRRVGEAVRVLRATGELPGPLLLASHESLRTQYECSIPELDWFV